MALLENLKLSYKKEKIEFCLKMLKEYEDKRGRYEKGRCAWNILEFLSFYLPPPNSHIDILSIKSNDKRADGLNQFIIAYSKTEQNQNQENSDFYEKIVIFLNKIRIDKDFLNY